MGDTEISWTHRPGTVGRTWNPVQGCQRVSEGCRNCYAERLAARFADSGWSQGLINLKTRKWNGESDTRGYQWTFRDRRGLWQDLRHADMMARCPYGVPGDQLWVREAHQYARLPNATIVAYRASCEGNAFTYVDPVEGSIEVIQIHKWRPGIHLRRADARLQLEVTGTRIERLQAISKEDAIAEGAKRFEGLADPSPYPSCENRWSMESPTSHHQCLGSPQTAFGNYFIKLHGQEVWDADPWVWCVSFKRLEVEALP